MNSAVDSRGIERGRCHVCSCSRYRAGTAGQKCELCAHPPAKHEKVSGALSSNQSTPQPQTFAAAAGSTGGPSTYSQQHGSYGPGYTSSGSYSHYQEPVKQPLVTQRCKGQGCYKFSYYDPSVGEFDYCSPKCRDEAILSEEKQRLQDDIKAFEEEVKKSTLHTSTSGKPMYESSQGQGRTSGIALGGSDSAAVQPRGQTTFKRIFQKSPSEDVGFIIAADLYKPEGHSFSGILILGFEYNSKAKYLIESGDIRLLDVITRLNEKEASPFTYPDEVKKRSCSLILDRSIALPEIRELIDKAKLSNPTHLVAVMNPRDIPSCPVDQGFGIDTEAQSSEGFYISSSTEHTPARFSMVNYGDEVIAYGFVKDNKLNVGKGRPKHDALQKAASDGKTLVLVLKRSTHSRTSI